jgi:hypothetical protein
MRMFVAVFIVTASVCSGGREMEAPLSSSAASVPPSAARPSLQEARAALEVRTHTEVGAISLNGYSFHREILLGHGMRVIAISRNLGGGLLFFQGEACVATRSTSEITWLQVFDVDEDGVAELITEEIDDRGTGVMRKSFYIYRIVTDRVETLWKGSSYDRETLADGTVVERESFLRFDASGAGRNTRVTHLSLASDGDRHEVSLEWSNGRLRVISPDRTSRNLPDGPDTSRP